MRYCVTAGAMLCLATLLPVGSAYGDVFSLGAQADTLIFGEGATNHQGERNEMIIGGTPVAPRHELIRWDLSGINGRIEAVTSASITFNFKNTRGSAGASATLEAYRITPEHGDWVETTSSGTGEFGGATWNSRDFGRDENDAIINRWAANGADGIVPNNADFADIFPDVIADADITFGQTGDLVFDLMGAPNLISMLNEWRLAGTESAGLLFKPSERITTQFFFDSKETTDDGGDTIMSATLDLDVTLGPELVPGDVDGDQDVDITDFNIIKANFRQAGITLSQGDLSGDGVANFADLKLWKDNFPTAAPGAALASIPEPTAVLLAGLSLLGVTCTRRRS